MLESPGGTIKNGSNSAPPGIVLPGFLFEPEVPLSSLKEVPIWNELEQLLDNPYNVALCSSLPASVEPLVRNTPGTTSIPGSPPPLVFPAYCTTSAVVRRPTSEASPPTFDGASAQLQCDHWRGDAAAESGLPRRQLGRSGQLLQCGSAAANADINVRMNCLLRGNNPKIWVQQYKNVVLSPGADHVTEAEIDDNAPIRADVSNIFATAYANAVTAGTAGGLLTATLLQDFPLLGGTCVVTVEPFPAPEGATACGGDPGEPGGARTLPVFGRHRADAYSRPAVLPSPTASTTPLAGAAVGGPITARLFDATRGGAILPRTGAAGGLKKPSLRIAPWSSDGSPNYLTNIDPENTVPSSENDYIRDRSVAAALGKSLFWDMQVGSDTVQSCGSCHVHAGADNRVKNQLNPNHLGNDVDFEVQPPNGTLTVSDFPFQKLTNPNVAADPKCTSPLVAHVNGAVLENTPNPVLTGSSGTAATGVTMTVCNKNNLIANKNNHLFGDGSLAANDVASLWVSIGASSRTSSLGLPATLPLVEWTRSSRICAKMLTIAPGRPIRQLVSLPSATRFPASPAYQELERWRTQPIPKVEPRNTPTVFQVALNFDNFWDGRANHNFNGGSVFGSSDPQPHVFVDNGGSLTPTRQIIRFVSMASLATGPGLSEFEMSLFGRNWAKQGKRLLQPGAVPLANQLVDPTDSLLGPYSNQPGGTKSPLCTDTAYASGKPGLYLVQQPDRCGVLPRVAQQHCFAPRGLL